jgi:hypothetical protein
VTPKWARRRWNTSGAWSTNSGPVDSVDTPPPATEVEDDDPIDVDADVIGVDKNEASADAVVVDDDDDDEVDDEMASILANRRLAKNKAAQPTKSENCGGTGTEGRCGRPGRRRR